MFKKPKILIDAQMLSRNQITGIGRYIEELLTFLTKYEEFDWEIVKPKPIKGYRTIWEHTLLPIETLIKKADLLFSPSNIIPLYLPKKVKVIVTVHDVRVKAFPETFSRNTRMYYNLIYSYLFKRANAVITVSEFSKSEILKYFPESEGKVYVIPNGINTQKFRFLNIPKKKQILFIGAIAKHKNIKVIFESFSRIYKLIPHKIVIVGSKDSGMPQDEEMFKLINSIPQERIIFTGKIGDEEVINLYNESEVFIFPSLYEGFGFPVLEAMSCGCPVIASNRSSIPEVCGDAGILFDPENPEDLAQKILEVTQNENLAKDLIKKGLERVKSFSWEETSKMYISLMKKVIYE